MPKSISGKDLSFPPAKRLRSRSAFQTVFKEGSFYRGKFVNFWVYDMQGLKRHDVPEAAHVGPLIGIVVSKRTSALAAVRNKWKRKIREVFRKNQKRISKNSVLIIQSRKIVNPPTSADLEADLNQLLEKGKLF